MKTSLRLATCALGLATALGSALVLAQPASAATISVTVGPCTSAGSPSVPSFTSGDTVDLLVDGTCTKLAFATVLVTSTSDVTGPVTYDSTYGGNHYWNITGAGTISVVTNPAWTSGAPMYLYQTIGTYQTVYLPAGGGGGGDVSSESATPPDITQQFGMPATGTCDAAAPASLNWAGVSSGGWGNTWAEWMNDGKGGAVCSRVLYYNVNTAAWAVR